MTGLAGGLMNAFRFRQKQVEPDLDVLLPERQPRPKPRNGFPVDVDVMDADFVTLQDPVGDLRNRLQAGLKGAIVVQPSSGLGRAMLRLRGILRQLDMRLGHLSEGSFTTLVSALVLFVFVAAGGFTLFGSHGPAPHLGPVLDITHVSVTPQKANGLNLVVINAIVENRANTAQAFPPVRADFYQDDKLIASTLIAPPAEEIGVGQSRGISARLSHPGGKAPQVKLSFETDGASHS
ncbi:MAG TPA: hypothetical protein DDW73_01630 [Rhizobium sp.]|nr:hypothetical protein [Rhizobium sp.]